MKNIHILPTDKPSRLVQRRITKEIKTSLLDNPQLWNNINIYITSDEDIKEGVDQWYLDKVLNEPYNSGGAQYSSKQDVIILTTDQDLIADGVQAIDDEFLEWFVKSPTCEYVEVEKESHIEIEEVSYEGDFQNVEYINYKIIIPQEEINFFQITLNAFEKSMNLNLEYIEEPKQETLEEFISNSNTPDGLDQFSYDKGLEAGAKWQAEKMYQIMKECWDAACAYTIGSHKDFKQTHPDFDEWFEQFKKK